MQGTFELTGASSILQAGLVGGSAGGTINIGAAEGSAAVAAGNLLVDTVALNTSASQVVFNHTDAGYTFAPDITGTGSVRQIAGTTILTGDNIFSGDTVVDGGLSAASDTALSADLTVFVIKARRWRSKIPFTPALPRWPMARAALGGHRRYRSEHFVLDIGANGGATTTFSGDITGAGALHQRRLAHAHRPEHVLGAALIADFGTTSPSAGRAPLSQSTGLTGLALVAGELDVDGGADFKTGLACRWHHGHDGNDTTVTVTTGTIVIGSLPADPASLTVSGGAIMESQFEPLS